MMGGQHHQHLTVLRCCNTGGPPPDYNTSLWTPLLERVQKPPLQEAPPTEKKKKTLPWSRVPQESLEYQIPAKPARERI